MAHSILAAIVTLGVLTSGDVCAWVCQAASASATTQANAGSHCGGVSGPEAPDPAAPSHEECPGCTLDVAATSSSLEGPGAGFTLAFAGALAVGELRGPMARPGRGPARGDRSPPRDVLSITSSLRL